MSYTVVCRVCFEVRLGWWAILEVDRLMERGERMAFT